MYLVFCDLVFTLIYMIYVFCAFSCAYMCLAPNEKESWWVLPKLGDMSTEFSYFMDSWSYLTYPFQFWLVSLSFLQWTRTTGVINRVRISHATSQSNIGYGWGWGDDTVHSV